jgi:precorrin-8X/cobalt-precorrin-8 methylmutase
VTEKTPHIRPLQYERVPGAIYKQSFATVAREANLDRFPQDLQAVITRLIHACGMVEIADRISFSTEAGHAGRAALQAGKPILCDCEMVGAGIIRRYLPKDNQVIVTLNDPSVPDLAKQIENTRSAAAVELWKDHLDGAVVAIGNAPTALFHLLELLDAGYPKPACILGFPVGFVGAAESKAELASNPRGCDYIALRGRKGGSAMASAAVNALAAGLIEVQQ